MINAIIPETSLNSLPLVMTIFVSSIVLIVLAARLGVYTSISMLARTWRWREETVGKTLGYVTSAPELVTTIYLTTAGLSVSALYNILSSNISNIILVLGVVFIIFRKRAKNYIKKLPYTLITVSLITPAVLLLIPTHINQPVLTVFILIVLYLMYVYYTRVRKQEPAAPVEYSPLMKTKNGLNHHYVKTLAAIMIGAAGLLLIVIGGDIFTLASETLTETFGVSQILIGAITGITTSLPELTTFYASAKTHKSQPETAYTELNHNLLASNASNIYLGYSVALIILLFISVV